MMDGHAPHVVRRFRADELDKAIAYFHEYGYAVLADAFPTDLAQGFWSDVERQIVSNERLSYSWYGQFYEGRNAPLEGKKLPRIIDFESHSRPARELLLAPVISGFLTRLYGIQPTCLQTLTYKYSSEQLAHSDKTLVSPPAAHDYDRETLAAAWFAIEASDESNGALVIYPGSHKLPKRGFYDGFDNSYDKYTAWLSTWLAENHIEATTFRAQPGDALFWHGDFVHAGGRIQSAAETPPTRKSYVCHYARIDPAVPSRDATWVRATVPGGSYFQKKEFIHKEERGPTMFDALLDRHNYPFEIHRHRDIRAGHIRGKYLEFHFPEVRQHLASDPIWLRALALAQDRGTLLPESKLANLYLILRYGVAGKGDVIEFGSYRGGSAIFLASVLRDLQRDTKVYALDTYAGMPGSDPVRDLHGEGQFADCDYAGFLGQIARHGMENHLVTLAGKFEDTLIPLIAAGTKFDLVHVDCDLYDGVRFAVEESKPAMNAGAYLVFDDPLHGTCLGAFDAVAETLIQDEKLLPEQAYPHLVFRYPRL